MDLAQDQVEAVALDFVSYLDRHGIRARIFGGAAFVLHQRHWKEAFGEIRKTKDIDVVVDRKSIPLVLKQLEINGGTANWDELTITYSRKAEGTYRGVHVDVYSDPLYLNHVIRLGERLEMNSVLLTYADLLATKLQLRRVTKKDWMDIIAILGTCEVVKGESAESIDLARVMELYLGSWGFFHSSNLIFDKMLDEVKYLAPSPNSERRLFDNIAIIKREFESVPKPWMWGMRARAGTVVPWFDETDT
jgi:hypothetical protein